MPLRSYARGNSDYLNDENKCSLSMELGANYGCVPGAPSSPSLFFAVDDASRQVAIAQGGVSSGATSGTKGLGKVTMVKKGDGIPGAV